MTKKEMATAVGAYCAALGIDPARTAYAVPYLTGEKALPAAGAAKKEDELKLLTLPEAGAVLGLSRSTIYRMTKDGQLTPVNFRGKNRIPLAQVVALAESLGIGDGSPASGHAANPGAACCWGRGIHPSAY